MDKLKLPLDLLINCNVYSKIKKILDDELKK